MASPIFTVGHSTHSAEGFIKILRRHCIQFVIDVRSVPFSRRMPHFNRDELLPVLRCSGIRYVHLPNEFGARRYDPNFLDEKGLVDFDRVRESYAFRHGVERLKRGSQAGHRIALMCAEEDPFRCHRFSMVSYQLVRENVTVTHIRGNGDLVQNDQLEERLWREYEQRLQKDMFEIASTLERPSIDLAYKLLEKDIAFNARMHMRTEHE